ncbi:MAG: extracellular solute-binding protein [Lachnospiraceae bacterium]|nr:extracellular solute-binding protein [Lachnospiraceae bacterium]
MKKKSMKLISAVLSMILAGSVMAGCAAQNSGSAASSEAPAAESASAADGEAITITIWDWDTTFTEHMTEYYKEQHPDKNINFEILSVSTTDFFQKLQGSLSSGEGVPDIVLCEMGYRGKVFDLGILDDLTQAPYNLDPSEMYDFAIDLGTAANGELYGIEQQVCPSGLAYRRDLAKEYFGTDDPAELEAMFPDWDSFIAAGIEVQKKSGGKEYMLPGIISDAFYILRNQTAAEYITDSTIDITGRYTESLTTLSKMNDAHIIMPGDSEATIAEGFANKTFIFYPCTAWVEKWYIEANDPDGSGNWALMEAPEGGFTFGGTSVCIYKDSKVKEAAWDYVRYTYGDGAGVEESYKQYGFMSGFKSLYAEDGLYLTTPSEYDAFFGGQELSKKYKEIMDKGMNGQVQTTNEANVLTAIGILGAAYESDPSMTAEDLIARLIQETQSLCPNVEVK